MRLPVRSRWPAPFGQKIELAETRDVSRGGLLGSGRETHAPRVPLRVIFPQDASPPNGQREVLARVARGREWNAAQPGCAVAIHFEGAERSSANGNRARRDPERRSSRRRLLAVPIRAPLEHVRWFQETMSLDFSPRGMRFRSQREHSTGSCQESRWKKVVPDTGLAPGNFARR